MKNCYLIGGSGFIGRHLAGLLVNTERKITVVGRKKVPDPPLPYGVHYVAGDYGDVAMLRTVARDADEIILLAYTTVPKTSFDDPVQDIMSNLPAAVKLFEMTSTDRLEKLIVVSSGGTVYGNPVEVPITENHPTAPISPYGITKLAIEKYAMMFHQTTRLPVICVRPANAYGEGQKPFAGQGFVATAMASVLGRKEILLFGEEGTVRDYIHVSDVANGIAHILDYGNVGEYYNIGSSVGRTNMEILNAIAPLASAANLRMMVKVFPKRLFDVPVNILDSRKLQRETGWDAKVGFNEGIRRSWDWFWENRNILSIQ